MEKGTRKKGSHKDCTHPLTKNERARCRAREKMTEAQFSELTRGVDYGLPITHKSIGSALEYKGWAERYRAGEIIPGMPDQVWLVNPDGKRAYTAERKKRRQEILGKYVGDV